MNIKDAVSGVFDRVRGGGGGDAPEPSQEEQAPKDGLDLIRSDHREVDALFAVALGDETPAPERRKTIGKIVQALTIHAEMEETLFYPALRKAGGKDERDSVLEAAEEHGVVKDLIAKIEASTGRDETMNAKLTVLKELVHHHVQEEEGTIFDEARRTLGEERLAALGEEMQRFKDRGGRGGRGSGGRGGSKGGGSKRGGSKSGGSKSGGRKTGSAKKSAARDSGGGKKAAGGKKAGGKKAGAKKSRSKR